MTTQPLRSQAQWKTYAAIGVIGVTCAFAATSCEQSPAAPTSPTPGSPTTFNLTGLVRDTVLRPVMNAKVEIVSGPLASQFTATDANGQFVFAGLTPATPTVDIIVTKEGYSPVTMTARNNVNTIITLAASTLIQLEGEYQVTFAAANSCGDIPPPLRRRTYSATIGRPTNVTHPSATAVVVTLGGADFYFGYGAFSGLVADDAVRLAVFSWDAFNGWLEDHPIFERLTTTTYLAFMGTATASGAQPGAPIAAVLDGTISYCASATAPSIAGFPPTCSVPVIDCRSDRHQLSLSRR
jgi:hypothetical protein